MKEIFPPGLLVAATASGAGKTVATLGLVSALRQLGLEVRAAKTGPDFIDPAFLAAVCNAPCANLDAWMCSPGSKRQPRSLPRGLGRLRRLLLTPQNGRKPDLWLVEGAMGLYDGGADGRGGTAQLASLLNLPVLLLLDAQGMGQSIAALAEGFLRHCPKGGRPGFLGVLCTHSGSSAHERLLAKSLAPVLASESLPLLGFLPRTGAPRLDSRHLGLVEACEALPGLDFDALGRWFSAHCDLHTLLQALGLSIPQATKIAARQVARPTVPLPATAPRKNAFFPQKHRSKSRLRIGIAHDAAFSFCYADLPALLAKLGAEAVFFSPLADAAPPPACAGLYFPGGYPELHAQELACNAPMLEALRSLAATGLPIYGECGGYIYLMRELATNGRSHALAGLLPLASRLGERLAALGYREAAPEEGWLACAAKSQNFLVRGHEFHYACLTDSQLPSECVPLWKVRDSSGKERGSEGCRLGNVTGSWLHLYPEGSRHFWACWLELAKAWSVSHIPATA